MWMLFIQSPWGEPRELVIKPGKTLLGRSADNDIAVADPSASRVHAEIELHTSTNLLIVRDLNSTNGTFTNRARITAPHILRSGDIFRIGEHVFTVQDRDLKAAAESRSKLGTRPLTRDLMLEALDHHAILLYKIARQLNTVLDLDSVLQEVGSLVRVSLGADRCEVILADQFGRLNELGFPASIAQLVIDQRNAVIIPEMPSDAEQKYGQSTLLMRVRSALCVPIIAGDELLGLVYMYKTDPGARPFDENDLRLAIAISHQAALTIQRTQLIAHVQKERTARSLLQRFLPPQDVERLLRNYLQTGYLPGLAEQTLTILFADIANSTGLAERMGAKQFGNLLTRYYQDMTEIVFRHGGMLDKYLGDGLMIVFGLSQSQSEPEISAVKAGLAMLDQVDAFNRDSEHPIELGIGINTGRVVAGYVGTDERVEFTVLGDPVNVAFRLESLARPNRLFIGPGTTAVVAGLFKMERVGPVELKGRTQPVQVHEVLRDLPGSDRGGTLEEYRSHLN